MAKRFFVSPQQGGQSWAVQAENSDQNMAESQNRSEAIQKGKEIAQKEHGVLSIQNEEGGIEDTMSFE